MIGNVLRGIASAVLAAFALVRMAWGCVLGYVAWWILTAVWPMADFNEPWNAGSNLSFILGLLLVGYVAWRAFEFFIAGIPAITPPPKVSKPHGSGTSFFANRRDTKRGGLT